MAGKTLDVSKILQPDGQATEIAKFWFTWNMLRQPKINDWTELRNYIYATDTTKTTNAKLPWKNKTTIPKICQIRDNLYANYMASMFQKDTEWLEWIAADRESNTREKVKSITCFMKAAISQKAYKTEMAKCVLDYIDYGNAFAMPVWTDGRVEVKDLKNSTSLIQAGYVGPSIQRISPLDIVFNPIAADWESTPKIVRSIVSLGEVKEMLQRMSFDGNKQAYEDLYKYLKEYRSSLKGFGGELTQKDEYLNVDGFTNYRMYIESNYCELLTFYGDLYDPEADVLLKNHIITVVDRHKILDSRPNPSLFGTAQIYHAGWRVRQDNLWAMGPLDNLVGMQYRLDHIENLKADVFDLIAFPPLKIKGYVEKFEWGPMARIHTDEDGDVEMIVPEWNVLEANTELHNLTALMEEMAGSPKEAMGFRTPGEKTKYEVQRLENASSRIFTSKISQFEEVFVEPGLNGMLELGKRNVTSDILMAYYDDEYDIQKFLDLSPNDISGNGRIRPYAARHFAEQAEMVQNLTNFFGSPIGGDPGVKAHFSTIKMAQMFEELFGLKDYKLVMPFVRMAEEADAQRLANAQQEQIMMEAMTSSGLTPDDVSQGAQQPTAGQPPAPGPGFPGKVTPGGPPPPPPTSPFTVGQGFPQGANAPPVPK